MLGARIHIALVDLAYTVAPALIARETSGRQVRPWWGILIVALLLTGLASIDEVGLWAVEQALPHRESRP